MRAARLLARTMRHKVLLRRPFALLAALVARVGRDDAQQALPRVDRRRAGVGQRSLRPAKCHCRQRLKIILFPYGRRPRLVQLLARDQAQIHPLRVRSGQPRRRRVVQNHVAVCTRVGAVLQGVQVLLSSRGEVG